MIRSSKLSLKFANAGKKKQLAEFCDEYRKVVQFFVNETWDMENLPLLLPKSITEKVETWLTARAVQAAAKQASGIVRGTHQKNKQRRYTYNKLLEAGKIKEANRVLNAINKESKPSCNTVNPELDSRFVKIEKAENTTFDLWITLGSLGNRMKVVIPLKKTRHFNKLAELGELRPCARICGTKVVVMFDLPNVPEKDSGCSIGLDMGISNVYSCSNGDVSEPDIHGHTLSSIQDKLSRKKKGSKAFLRAQEHRKNYINRCLNELNLSGIREIQAENLKDVRRGRRTSRKLSHWTYTDIKRKLEAICEENGVRLTYKTYAYSSQRCSQCGWTQKTNRNGKSFLCKNCGYTADADLNAAVNLSLDLPPISAALRRERRNLKGFFYHIGQEPIVPAGQKANKSKHF